MTDNPMTAKHLLDQIVRGLDGVNAGPYVARQEGANRWRIEIPREGYVPLSIALVCTTILEVGCTNENTAANAAHFSRCSPDTMREIAAYVRDLEERLAKAAEALEPFAADAAKFDPPENDDDFLTYGTSFTFGDLRRARKAISTIQES